MKKWLLFLSIFPICTAIYGQNIDSILKLGKIDRIQNITNLIYSTIQNTPNKLPALKNELIPKLNNDEILLLELMEKSNLLHNKGEFDNEIKLTEKFTDAFKKTGNNYLVAMNLFTSGVRNEDINYQNRAFESFMHCYDELLKDPNKKFFEQSGVLHSIASKYYKFKDYAQSIIVAKNAEPLSNKFNANKEWFKIVNADLIGMAYLKNSEFDSALIWLNTTFDRAKEFKYKDWYGIATGNIGNVYYLQKNYSKAIGYFKVAIDSCTKYRIWDNLGAFCNNLADCYLRTNQVNEVSGILNLAKTAIDKQPSNELWQKYYEVSSSYCKISQQNAIAFQYEDSSFEYNKKLGLQYDLNKKIKVEADWAYAKTALQQELVLQKEKTTKWIFVSIMIFTTLLLIIAIQYYNKQRKKQKIREESLVNENTKISTELEKARLDLNIFKDSLRIKNELIGQYTKEIGILEKQNLPINDLKIETLESLRKSSILTDKDWMEFQFTFRKAFPGFLASLKTKYKDLTPAEIRFLMFIKMDLSPKEMATTLGVGAEAIRNLRFRVKKKIDITGFEDLEAFTMAIE